MLKVKGNYLYENDKPFFYQADTAWLLFDKVKEKDIELYLTNRKYLGYNVIQSVLVYSLPDLVIDGKMPSGIRNPYKKEYWEFVIKYVRYAKKLGIYMALLPCWGHFVKQHIITLDNAKRYATFLGNYFNDCDNIIWVLGGDVRGDENLELFNILGNTLKELNPNILITFHPFGRTGSYLWFNDVKWLDFNMFQSGHRRYDQLTLGTWDDKLDNEDSFGEDNWKYVRKAHSYSIKKPVLDAEPSYEGIVQGLHDPKEPYWEARHIRRYAYWSVFEGACGFTYGNNAIIQFYEGIENNPSYGVRETWKDALSSPGGMQVQYLKELFYKYHLELGIPHPEFVLNQHERHHRSSVIATNYVILIYTYKGDLLNVSLKDYNGIFKGFWMNPECNARSYIGEFEGKKEYKFRPVRKRELSNDWVLILERNN